MRAWQFDQADALLTDAKTILDQRVTIAKEAVTAGLTAPDTLRAAFERPDGFASATLEATAELAAIDRYDAAVAAHLGTTDMLQGVGLLGTSPAADLERARTLFATGDLAGAASAAASAESAWAGAEDVGRGRLVSIGLLALAFVVGLILLTGWLRGRRRRATAVVAQGPYATLAATPDPVDPVAVGDDVAGGAGPD